MKLRHTLLLCAACAAANAIYVPDYLRVALAGVRRQTSATDDYGRPKPYRDPNPHQSQPDELSQSHLSQPSLLDPYVEASEIAAKTQSGGPKASVKTTTQKGGAAGLAPTLPLAAALALLL